MTDSPQADEPPVAYDPRSGRGGTPATVTPTYTPKEQKQIGDVEERRREAKDQGNGGNLLDFGAGLVNDFSFGVIDPGGDKDSDMYGAGAVASMFPWNPVSAARSAGRLGVKQVAKKPGKGGDNPARGATPSRRRGPARPPDVPQNDGVARKPPPHWLDPGPNPFSDVVVKRERPPGSVRYSRRGRDGRNSTWSPGPRATRTGPNGPHTATGPGRLILRRPDEDLRPIHERTIATLPDPHELKRKLAPRSIRNSRRTERKRLIRELFSDFLGALDPEKIGKPVR